MKVTPSTRRRFLRTSVAAAATVQILPRALLGGPKFVPPSEKVNVAVVGVGGRGRRGQCRNERGRHSR